MTAIDVNTTRAKKQKTPGYLYGMIENMKSLLRRKSSCVLATTDGDKPHCSLMAYITLETADRLFLVTPRDTKKYRNIKRHPSVSLLIDTRGEQTRNNTQALTLTGTYYILEHDDEILINWHTLLNKADNATFVD